MLFYILAPYTFRSSAECLVVEHWVGDAAALNWLPRMLVGWRAVPAKDLPASHTVRRSYALVARCRPNVGFHVRRLLLVLVDAPREFPDLSRAIRTARFLVAPASSCNFCVKTDVVRACVSACRDRVARAGQDLLFDGLDEVEIFLRSYRAQNDKLVFLFSNRRRMRLEHAVENHLDTLSRCFSTRAYIFSTTPVPLPPATRSLFHTKHA